MSNSYDKYIEMEEEKKASVVNFPSRNIPMINKDVIERLEKGLEELDVNMSNYKVAQRKFVAGNASVLWAHKDNFNSKKKKFIEWKSTYASIIEVRFSNFKIYAL